MSHIVFVKDRRYNPIEALQLTWANWSEVCLFVNIGEFNSGHAKGVYICPDGTIVDDFPGEDHKLGLKIPKDDSFVLASQGDWLVKDSDGELHIYSADLFDELYEVVVPTERPIIVNSIVNS